ncbi:NAD(P)-binding protein [Periconia macrospinosa]|uniref:NAD(P)-binding protein n=1 Tax=Periconia macrospinosa TaxID=97972 RepID=A0A2V1DD03_9PLEO|nr:NAD(P)-binding protein [Periconia macrospinosa]
MPQLTWFVTGCSSGIGKSLSAALIARGERVVATARNLQDIAHLQSESVLPLQLDVTSSPETLRMVVDEAINHFGGVDVLVNNAGYLQGSFVEEADTKDYISNFMVNFCGTMNVTRTLIPHFRSKSSGTIIFVGSRAGWQGDMGASPYNATKFALEGILDTLQLETSGFGIRSMIVVLGYFRTELFSTSRLIFTRSHPNKIYDPIETAVLDGVAKVHGHQPGDPDKLAHRIVDVVKGEGMAAGKPFPKRLPFGEDALKDVRQKCEETLKICDEWEEVIKSTNIEGSGI